MLERGGWVNQQREKQMREKWRERVKRAEEGNTQRTSKGSFPFIKNNCRRETVTVELKYFLEPVLNENM